MVHKAESCRYCFNSFNFYSNNVWVFIITYYCSVTTTICLTFDAYIHLCRSYSMYQTMFCAFILSNTCVHVRFVIYDTPINDAGWI
ncbi:hypothetical protein AQUCO_01800251v1 [Aquilegia coerulea]|uniref:Uncharacterized protein n=1 Tax=Aquilegia coerulea TaxID=218851 RepID=A0A2G5DKM6_AQUCA|nr:hypothetical protein AQUCO_01800251v1 [Aquilegia coerulea]